MLGRQKPECVVKVNESYFWVIEAKAKIADVEKALKEAIEYAQAINESKFVRAAIVTGVGGSDDENYEVETYIILENGSVEPVRYNNKRITGFLSREQARYLVDNNTSALNELVTEEHVLLAIAEQINEELHRASINKDARATVMASVLLSMVGNTMPNINAPPDTFIKDVNNRAEEALIAHSKRDFADYIELKLPQDESAKNKYKKAVAKVFFLLRKINIKAAMDGSDDLLGKFYEVFLKYGNGAKDIGIVLTPRHVTKFSSYILDIKSSDLIYDPACGTGGFLVAAYDRVRVNEPDAVEMFKKHRIFGVEQQANVAALAIVNMIFRGDGKNNIINGDCLSLNLNRKIRNEEVSAVYQTEQGDRPPISKVLMNPPFALKSDAEQEFTFIDHALKQIIEGGLLLSVVPVSVMYAGGRELLWRKRLIERNSILVSMVFPNDLFYPQASVEPAIIVIKKGVPHEFNAETLFVRITDDGFVKLKKRRLPHRGPSQLDTLAEEIRLFISGRTINEIPGVMQSKVIDTSDPNLEIIPQHYLENGPMSKIALKSSLTKVYSELLFQQMRRDMTQ